MRNLFAGIFRSSYGLPSRLAIQTGLSAFIITFYTTEGSLLDSFTSMDHFSTLLMTIVLMFLLFSLMGHLSLRLDREMDWIQHETSRTLYQIGLGILTLGFIAFQTVCLVYWYFLDIDLWNSAYLERDFVVVMCCVICVNIYHYALYWREENKRNKHTIDTLTQQLENSSLREVELHQDLSTSDAKSVELHRQMGENNRQWEKKLEMLTKQVGDGLQLWQDMQKKLFSPDLEHPVHPSRVVQFYLSDLDKEYKYVHMLLRDGTDVVVANKESLAELEKKFPYLFIRLGRGPLVNRFEIADIKRLSAKKYAVSLMLEGSEPIVISAERYEELRNDVLLQRPSIA